VVGFVSHESREVEVETEKVTGFAYEFHIAVLNGGEVRGSKLQEFFRILGVVEGVEPPSNVLKPGRFGRQNIVFAVGQR
jgi:hypothetical protein